MSKLIIANWKSHKTVSEARTWLETYYHQTLTLGSTIEGVEVILAPSSPLLSVVAPEVTRQSALSSLAAQDCSQFPMGAYTGAVSAQTLASMDAEYVVVGHSERREYFEETDATVARKVAQVLEAGMTPVLCIDEPYLSSQAAALETAQLARCIVAYEPLEAIGSGLAQPLEEVAKIVSQIKSLFGEVPIIYGGSVATDSVASYLEICDGVLVGGASLDAQVFAELVTRAATTRTE